MLPVGVDTLLRAVRRRSTPDWAPVQVIGIDEWAWRRRQSYGRFNTGVLLDEDPVPIALKHLAAALPVAMPDPLPHRKQAVPSRDCGRAAVSVACMACPASALDPTRAAPPPMSFGPIHAASGLHLDQRR
jgi:hypothetical protein